MGAIAQLGIDETTFLSANREHPTLYATGLVDLERRVVIDVVPGNSASNLGSWLDRQPAPWLAAVHVVATDLTESYRAGLDGQLDDHALRLADPFHVVRLANRCLDQVRRRVQNATLGHCGRKRDPLYRIRKLVLTGTERLEARASTGCCSGYGWAIRPGGAWRLAGQGVGARRLPGRSPRRRGAAPKQGHRGPPRRSGARGRLARQDPRPAGAPRPSPITRPAPPMGRPRGSTC